MHVTKRPVGMNDSIFDVHRAHASFELIASLLPARTIGWMNHRLEIVINADVGVAVATTEHAVEMRRPVILVLTVKMHDVVAEVRNLLRDRQLRFAATQGLF